MASKLSLSQGPASRRYQEENLLVLIAREEAGVPHRADPDNAMETELTLALLRPGLSQMTTSVSHGMNFIGTFSYF